MFFDREKKPFLRCTSSALAFAVSQDTPLDPNELGVVRPLFGDELPLRDNRLELGQPLERGGEGDRERDMVEWVTLVVGSVAGGVR